jgi:hypothetical protein
MKKKLKWNLLIYDMSPQKPKEYNMSSQMMKKQSPTSTGKKCSQDIQECFTCGLRFPYNKHGFSVDRSNFNNGQKCFQSTTHFCSKTCLKADIIKDMIPHSKEILEAVNRNIEKVKENIQISIDNKEDIDKKDLSGARAFQFEKKFLESVIRLNYYEAKVLYDTCIDRMSDFAEECLADGDDEYYMSVLNFSAAMGGLVRTLKTYHEL